MIPEEVLGYMKRTIETFAGPKRKYDELLDQTEREAQQRAVAKRVNDMFGREERAKRRDRLKELESELNKKNQTLLRRERTEVKRLERCLEC